MIFTAICRSFVEHLFFSPFRVRVEGAANEICLAFIYKGKTFMMNMFYDKVKVQNKMLGFFNGVLDDGVSPCETCDF